MVKFAQKCVALVVTAALALSCALPAFAAGANTTTQIEVTFRQTEARSMLPLVNSFRTGSEAFYANQDNQTTTSLVGQLGEFVYDYNLERVAMQRAAEIAVLFSHTRPNATSWTTTYNDFHLGYATISENIAIGQASAEQAFLSFKEDNLPYGQQGHRRNMLSACTGIGIAMAEYGGTKYWVQAIGTLTAPNTTQTPANDSTTSMAVEVSSSLVNSVAIDPVAPLTLDVGTLTAAPKVGATLTTVGNWEHSPAAHVTASPSWSVTSGSAVAINPDGTLTAQAVGTATLSAQVLGQTVTCSVTVSPTAGSPATSSTAASSPATGLSVALDQTSYPYTGQPITPAASVKWGTIPLTEGVDYTVTYANNTQEGTATVTVTGLGRYSGTVTRNFTITPCPHQWDAGTPNPPATCTQDGVNNFTCALCGASYTQPIPATGHTYVDGSCTACQAQDPNHASNTPKPSPTSAASDGRAVPSTGDSTQLLLCGGVAIILLTGLTILFVFKRKA